MIIKTQENKKYEKILKYILEFLKLILGKSKERQIKLKKKL